MHSLDWVRTAGLRVRGLGQVQHAEAFIVPKAEAVTISQTKEARKLLEETDWKAYDVVVTIVPELPEFLKLD